MAAVTDGGQPQQTKLLRGFLEGQYGLMRHTKIHQQGCLSLLHDPDVLDTIPDWLFDPAGLESRRLVTGASPGRRSAWFFRHAGLDMVLRHYWRGGMVARISPDVYVWTGRSRTRPWREWHLLTAMRHQGLPVPTPVAARVRRHGLGYRGDLITLTIADAVTFDQCLRDGRHDPALWRHVGSTIGRFHAAGFRHADLNVRNILVDSRNGVWLIDWDRGEQRRDRRWTSANLTRLRRSLDKDPALSPHAEKHWNSLLAGHGAAVSGRRVGSSP